MCYICTNMPHSWPTEKLRQYLKDRYYAQRKLFISTLGGCCAKCGSTSDLEIDHKDPREKSFNIGRLWADKRINEALVELSKCQLLCERCHLIKSGKETTIRQDGTFKHGTTTGWMKKKCRCNLCAYAHREWHNNRNANRRNGRPGYKPRNVLVPVERVELSLYGI